MTVKRIDIKGVSGIPLRVLLVPANGKRPNHDVQCYDKPTVEFYDSRYDHTPDGQFIGGYFVSTFCNALNGIALYGGEPEWAISADTVKLIQQWIRRESV